MNLSVTTNPNPKFTITATGIEFSGDLSLTEWGDLGRTLIPLAKKTGFMFRTPDLGRV